MTYESTTPLTHYGTSQIKQFLISEFQIMRKNGSVCDGDSGAGFFVEKGNVRYYIGAVGGSQAGITNCNAPLGKFAPNGGMSGVNPTYKFLV
jgi:secreted trypsin-like serine protease